jgi:inorganic pyrophosphatase
MYYPCDYGFIPQTLSEDGDPCDVFLLVTNPTFPGCLVQARPIGILYTSDNEGDDPKIIAVPINRIDPRRDEIQHIDDLGQHMKKEMLMFFKEIKLLEHEKYDKVDVR